MSHIKRLSAQLTTLRIPHQCHHAENPDLEDDEIIIDGTLLLIQVPNEGTPLGLAEYLINFYNGRTMRELMTDKDPARIAQQVQRWIATGTHCKETT